MATPDFVLELRRHVGHAPLWMPGTTVVILRPAPGCAPIDWERPIAPEAVDGGPIALVEDGDRIRVDIAGRSIDLDVPAEVLEERRRNWTVPENHRLHGTLGKYAKLVGSASTGAVTTD